MRNKTEFQELPFDQKDVVFKEGGKVDDLIAFWDWKSRGTKIMIEVAKEKGLKVYGGHWDRNDPDHQVVCRIIVDGEEIYIGADQGTTTQDTEVYIHGPVYIPQKDNN